MSLFIKITSEMSFIVNTVEDRIQNAISTFVNKIITLGIELAVRLMKASSGRDTANVMPNSGLEEQRVVTTSFEHSAEKKNTFHEFSLTDET